MNFIFLSLPFLLSQSPNIAHSQSKGAPQLCSHGKTEGMEGTFRNSIPNDKYKTILIVLA